MSAPRRGAGSAGRSSLSYFEPARSYASAFVLLLILGIGFFVDMTTGGALVHIYAWVVAITLVVGIDIIAIRTARELRSIAVTADELRVGDAVIARTRVLAVEREVDPMLPVLGQSVREGLSRGTPGLALRLVDGPTILVPTRHPEQLAAALEVASVAPEVRPAAVEDLAQVAEIDRRAATLFRVSGIDLPDIPFPADELHQAKAIFVAGHPAVGYIHVDEVDGLAHVAGLAVLPGSMRRGLGTQLLEAASTWAKAHRYPAITLITYADISWNGPFYAARGFVRVADLTPELTELRDWERAVGLDALGPRIVMRREL
ncbi:MAG: GNAT family N-acetyltransferase [Actinomycetota bacterium]|nr:GNAT family N-acetyltransferase [Actinomycetota bacterium]